MEVRLYQHIHRQVCKTEREEERLGRKIKTTNKSWKP